MNYIIASIEPEELGRITGLIILLIIIIIVVKAANKKKINGAASVAVNKKITCDGCGERIEGKFIRIKEKDLTQPIDYCSEKCKHTNLERDRIKFAAQEIE